MNTLGRETQGREAIMFEQNNSLLLSDKAVAVRMKRFLESAFEEEGYTIELLAEDRVGIITHTGKIIRLEKRDMRYWSANTTVDELKTLISDKIQGLEEERLVGQQLQEYTLQMLPYGPETAEYPGRQFLNLYAIVSIKEKVGQLTKLRKMTYEQLKKFHVDATEAYVSAFNNSINKPFSILAGHSNVQYASIEDVPKADVYEFVREMPEQLLLLPVPFYDLAGKLEKDLFVVVNKSYVFCFVSKENALTKAQERLKSLNEMSPEDQLTQKLYLVSHRRRTISVLDVSE